MQRIAQVIGIKPEAIPEYERIHAAVWPEVLATISSCNIHNYSIFRHGTTLFAYFEYHGSDLAADMRKMAADPKTQEWWRITDPMQEQVAGGQPGEWWTRLPEVFHTD
ncbi:MAG: L-rhamnose mutarotase [Chloroflexi bacterium]|nr:L-rhamnose mutarotase [Chloroflexota bacterium]